MTRKAVEKLWINPRRVAATVLGGLRPSPADSGRPTPQDIQQEASAAVPHRNDGPAHLLQGALDQGDVSECVCNSRVALPVVGREQRNNYEDARCAGEIKALSQCMAAQAKKPKEVNTINYHLQRLSRGGS